MGKLEGKIALVTGGNSGIGLATAKRFVSEGAYVFITGRREPELAAAVKEIGRNVTGVQGDVSNLDDLDRLFSQIKREKGRLDIVGAARHPGQRHQPWLGDNRRRHYHRIRSERLPQNSGITEAARTDRSHGRYRAGGGLLRFIRFENGSPAKHYSSRGVFVRHLQKMTSATRKEN